MAKATTLIEKRELSRAEQDAQALAEIVGAVTQQRDAMLAFVDIVGTLHQAGILSLVQGILKSRHELGVMGINQLNKSGAQRIIKNGVSAMQFMAQLDPDRLKQVLGAVAHGLEQAQPSDRRIGMWGMVNTLNDPDVNTALSVMINFMRGMGEGLPHAQR